MGASASSSRRVWLMLIAASIGWCITGCRGDGLEEFNSEEGRFRIRMPGTPSRKKDPRLPKAVQMVRLEDRSGSYEVAWEDLTGDGPSRDERLDQLCEERVKATEKLEGKVLYRKKITVADGHPARELLLQESNKRVVVRDRMVLVDSRLYQIVVTGPRWWVESATATKVLDSFRVVEE
jgi:hypothetical protein